VSDSEYSNIMQCRGELGTFVLWWEGDDTRSSSFKAVHLFDLVMLASLLELRIFQLKKTAADVVGSARTLEGAKEEEIVGSHQPRRENISRAQRLKFEPTT